MTKPKPEPKKRQAPYCNYAAFRQFVDRYSRVNAPAKVDVKLLQMFGIAKANEWALLSALKFLNLIDDTGVPTESFKLIQSAGGDVSSGLQRLLQSAYSDFFAHGFDLEKESYENVRNYFATTYSLSQADRATKFFLALAQDGGYPVNQSLVSSLRKADGTPRTRLPRREVDSTARRQREQMIQVQPSTVLPLTLLQAKSKLLEKLPTFDASWQPETIKAVVESFKELMMELEDAARSDGIEETTD